MSQPISTKRISRRTFLNAAATMVGISALTACVAPTAPQTADGEAASASEGQSIVVWTMYEPPYDQWPDGYIKAFTESHPDYMIDHLGKIGYSNIGTKLTASVAGGDAPDVASFWAAPAVGQFAPNDLIIALDDYLQRDQFDWSKYTSAAQEMVTVDGMVWAIPGGHNTYAMLYNKTIFEEFGLDPETGPATIEELDAWAEEMWKFNDDGSVERSGFLPWQPEDWNSFNWFAAWGAKLYDSEAKQVLLNDENAIACYEWYFSHIQKYGMKPVLDWVASSAPGYGGRSVPEGPLYTDRIGMWHGGQWYVDLARRYGGETLKFGVTPLPQSPLGEPKTSRFEADVLMVMSGAQNPDAGWEFINWVYDPETETPAFQFLLEMSGLPSSLKYLQNATEYRPELSEDAEWKTYADIAATGHLQPDPKIPVFQKLTDEINAARDAILNEAKTVQQALDDANAAVQSELDTFLASKQ